MKTKLDVILLALFFGGFGAHRFYLGNIGIGFLYLIFCWTYIPFAISIIEVIYFCFLKQEDFDVVYNSDFLIKKSQLNNLTK